METEKALYAKFDIMNERYKDGKKILKDLQDMIDELGEAEKAYSKSLAKAAKTNFTPGKNEPSTLGDALNQWRTKTDAMARSHQELTSLLASESKSIATLTEAQSRAKKGAEAEVLRMRSDVDRLAGEVPKIYSKYTKLSREAEEALLAFEQAQWTHQPEGTIQKLGNVYQQKKKAAQQADDVYKSILDDGKDNAKRAAILKTSLQTYERLNQERVQFLHDMLARLANAHGTIINTIYEANNSLIALVASVQWSSSLFDTISAELQTFESRDNSNDSRFLYIPYADQLDHRAPVEPEPTRSPPPPQAYAEPVREEPLDLTFAPKITGPIYTNHADQMQPSLASTTDSALLKFMQQQGVQPRREEELNPDLTFAAKISGPIYTNQSDLIGSQRSFASTTDAALLKYMQQQRPGPPPAQPPQMRARVGSPPPAIQAAGPIPPPKPFKTPTSPTLSNENNNNNAFDETPPPPPPRTAAGNGSAPVPPPRGQSRR